jgi:diguanylate cyclase (GGDEF)-like protein
MDRHIQVLNKQAYIDYVNASVADPVSLLIIDIDKFKAVNDQYGHPVGDVVLLKVVDAIKQCIRKDDLVGRIGGEEFAVVLLNTDAEKAYAKAEDFRKAVAEKTTIFGEKCITVTVSIGVAERDQTTTDFDALINHADHALYQAKHSGRNRTVIAH